MTESEASEAEIPLNGEVTDSSMGKKKTYRSVQLEGEKDETLYSLLHRFLVAIFTADPETTLFQRIKTSVQDIGPKIPEASKNSIQKLLLWTRQGSPLRALLVLSVGSIILLAVTGVLVFMVFFLIATISAIVMSLLVSLAAAGGFLAMFFTCLATIYVGALLSAVFVISAATITTITVSLIATGWIGFFLTVWLVTKKSMGLAKHSLSVTGSTFLAYTASRRVHHLEPEKASQ